jgi:nitrite reductase/ring-hydroxylating ferredoxin subunit
LLRRLSAFEEAGDIRSRRRDAQRRNFPHNTAMEPRWTVLADEASIDPGWPHPFEAGGRRLVLCRTREGLFALEDRCTHAETPMSEGRLRGCRLVCPLHGAAFDVRDGRVLGGPATRPLTCFPLRVVEGRVEVLLAGSDA